MTITMKDARSCLRSIQIKLAYLIGLTEGEISRDDLRPFLVKLNKLDDMVAEIERELNRIEGDPNARRV